MSTWKGIVGTKFTPNEFDNYVRGLTFNDWKPTFVVLHNTSAPRLSESHTTHKDCPGKNVLKADIIQRVIDRIPIAHDGEHRTDRSAGDNGTPPVAAVVLQSPELQADSALQEVAANRKMLQRVLGSNVPSD